LRESTIVWRWPDGGQSVLDPVIEFIDQELLQFFGLLAFGDIAAIFDAPINTPEVSRSGDTVSDR